MINEQQDSATSGNPEQSQRFSGTYFRVAYYTHLNLSRQADHKAHLMLGLNTLVLSAVVSKHHVGTFGRMHNFWIPNVMLILVCFSVAILAILASRPHLPRRPAEQTPNWLFFGSFAAFSYSAFEENMLRLTQNDAALQEAMSRDLYLLGRALARKYKYLTYCYRVFGIGIPGIALLYLTFWLMH